MYVMFLTGIESTRLYFLTGFMNTLSLSIDPSKALKFDFSELCRVREHIFHEFGVHLFFINLSDFAEVSK